MARGRRTPKQSELFLPTAQLLKGPGPPFDSKLNDVLGEGGFDGFVESRCAPYYKRGGRPGLPPGVYFRMLFVGYFEGRGSQRGIAWRCADSLALRDFLGFTLIEATPVHASMTIIRQRLPEPVFDRGFQLVLGLLAEAGLIRGNTLGIDATTLEANAAMKSIVRRDTGGGWKQYVRELARAEGIETPSEEERRRLDRARQDKEVSNQQGPSRTDQEARILRMKDGRTPLAYKAEPAVDLQSEAIVAAHVTHAERGDADTAVETLVVAQANLVAAGSQTEVRELGADKGYHDNRRLAQCASWSGRTSIPERRQKHRRWTDKPAELEAAFRAHWRRVRKEKGRRLNRWAASGANGPLPTGARRAAADEVGCWDWSTPARCMCGGARPTIGDCCSGKYGG